MTRNEMDHKAMARAFLGNELAISFMRLWSAYCHAIDDIEDEETTPEFRLRTFALAIEIYTHPFFLQNIGPLKQVAILCTNAYADTVGWEKSDQKWQAEFADVYRHYGQEMALAVAGICAGPERAYEHIRSISGEWRAMAFWQHHDKDEKPT